MAKRTTKKTTKPVRPQLGDGVEILNAGSVLEDPITSTLETNYMPYAMSVIVSRALPEIDGFKPAHRKLLYTMYGMGLLKGARTKSANIVGSTMHLNPHGDAAIYDTMVRMGRGNESLLVPFVDSKGNFGKAYSRDMSCAAARDLPHHSGQQYPGHCSRHGLQHLLLQSGRAVRHHRGPDERSQTRYLHHHARPGFRGRRPDPVR